MKTLKLVCFVLICALSADIAASPDDVAGAFGLVFGEQIPKGIKCNLLKKHISDNCFLIPPKPFISFNSYRVSVAKISGSYKVYQISGYKNMGEDYIKCTMEAELIAKKIERKYNIKFTKERKKPLIKTKKSKGIAWKLPNSKVNKSIYVSCYRVNPNFVNDNNGFYQLYIAYEAPAIYDKAVMESVNMTEIRNSDDSGL